MPGCAGDDLLSGDESVAQPPVEGLAGDAEDLPGPGDGDHACIVVAGTDILVWPWLAGWDAQADPLAGDACLGPPQAGAGGAALLGQDVGDGGVVVALGQAGQQGSGVLIGGAV